VKSSTVKHKGGEDPDVPIGTTTPTLTDAQTARRNRAAGADLI